MIKLLSVGCISLRWLQRLLGIALVVIVAGCATQDPFAPLPTSTPTGEAFYGPPPPLAPAGVGTGQGEPRSLTDLLDVVSCLADGQPAYALLQNNANVLSSPVEGSCQIGRAASGSLVRVEGVYQEGAQTPWVTLDRRQRLAELALTNPIGYTEDIQPIFESVCSSCHGSDVKTLNLQVTDYDALMEGSLRGPVVSPGDPDSSKLWIQIESGVMPLIGELSPEQKRLVYEWVLAGAPEQRSATPDPAELWLHISMADFSAANNNCDVDSSIPHTFIRADLAHIASCAAAPTAEQLAQLRTSARPETQTASLQSDVPPVDIEIAPVTVDDEESVAAIEDTEVEAAAEAADAPAAEIAPVAEVPAAEAAPRAIAAPAQTRIGAAPLGLPAPSDADPWMIGRGGFCVEQRLQQRLERNFGITSLAFAPDGRLFMGLDSPSTGDGDPNILFDAFHPSRSVVVYNTAAADQFYTPILEESSRVTGLVWYNGAVYLNRAGEVGRIVDGGVYERLAAGFAVNGRLFHANNGIAVANGWLYVSAGGVRDGFSDGIINPGDGDIPAETQAVNIAGGGNNFAARLVRAPIDRLVSERHIGVFQTAARGFRNPYGLTADPFGRLWITDNGATNVGEEYLAGDEIDLFDPAQAGGNEASTPFYGFPIAITGQWKDWWTAPVLPLRNTSAPTGITWANGTIYYAQYGRDPGLYRLATAGGQVVAERVLLAWPIQAVTTAPDGAIWIGTGTGGLYRLTPGC